MAGAAAARADDVVGDVGLVRAEPGLVVGGAAIGAARPVVLAQRPVQQGELAQLVAPQVVLALRHLHALADDLVDLRPKERMFFE